MTIDPRHEAFMREALREGRKALPRCLPNPPVGCVLVRGGEIVARGHTQVPYEPHAEPMALALLEGDLSDVVVYCTLEPCSFHNRTPSCARELIRRGIKTVYVGIADPHPRNRGAGVALLRAGGVDVVERVLEAEARRDLGPYVWQEGEGDREKVGD